MLTKHWNYSLASVNRIRVDISFDNDEHNTENDWDEKHSEAYKAIQEEKAIFPSKAHQNHADDTCGSHEHVWKII